MPQGWDLGCWGSKTLAWGFAMAPHRLPVLGISFKTRCGYSKEPSQSFEHPKTYKRKLFFPYLCSLLVIPGCDMGFPTIWYVRLAKPQINLLKCAVLSEPLLVA